MGKLFTLGVTHKVRTHGGGGGERRGGGSELMRTLMY